jgi:hypothetical protein
MIMPELWSLRVVCPPDISFFLILSFSFSLSENFKEQERTRLGPSKTMENSRYRGAFQGTVLRVQ